MANGARVRVAVSWVVKGCLLGNLLACLKFLQGKPGKERVPQPSRWEA